MYTYINIDTYAYISTNAYLAPGNSEDVYRNPFDKQDICIYNYVHVSINNI